MIESIRAEGRHLETALILPGLSHQTGAVNVILAGEKKSLRGNVNRGASQEDGAQY